MTIGVHAWSITKELSTDILKIIINSIILQQNAHRFCSKMATYFLGPFRSWEINFLQISQNFTSLYFGLKLLVSSKIWQVTTQQCCGSNCNFLLSSNNSTSLYIDPSNSGLHNIKKNYMSLPANTKFYGCRGKIETDCSLNVNPNSGIKLSHLDKMEPSGIPEKVIKHQTVAPP